MRVCKIEGCGRKHATRGYCNKHWHQMRRHGKILKRTRHDPNEIIIKGAVAEIVLYDRYGEERERAIIDAEDVEKVNSYKWSLSGGHVRASPLQKHITLQRVIAGGGESDHKDRNKLNNCKSNLRSSTYSQNAINRGKATNNTSGYKGVCWDKSAGKWKAQIGAKLEKFCVGYFKDKFKAATAYNLAAIKHHGEFACLNKI